MSAPGPPFEIRYSPGADAVIAALPRLARHALAAALKHLAAALMQAGKPYDSRWPPEFASSPSATAAS